MDKITIEITLDEALQLKSSLFDACLYWNNLSGDTKNEKDRTICNKYRNISESISKKISQIITDQFEKGVKI